MTAAGYEDLPPLRRRKLFWSALVRPALSATALTVLYFLLPLDEDFTRATVWQLAAGVVAVAALVTWQTIGISRAAYPRLRAVQALATTLPLFLLLFATTYFVMESTDPSSFTQPLTRIDSIYFTVTTFATVGYGDIAARSQPARVITTVQMVADLLLVGLVLQAMLATIRANLKRRAAPPP